MKQETVNLALQKIAERRRQAEQEFERKMKPLYENSAYVELEKAYTRAVIENSKNATYGGSVDLAKQNRLKSELDKMKNGIKKEFFCKKCNDEGFKDGEMCSCLKQEISKILLSESGFEKLERFEECEKISENQTLVNQKMKQWCNSDFKKDLIYLAGPTGVGKTHLLKCMANELIEKGKIIKIVTAFKMSLDFRNFTKTNAEEYLSKYLDCDVLFIDDLGTEPIFKNSTIENLYLIINERKMRKLPTVITSNLDLADIRERYDERIYSRIVDRQNSITIFMAGADLRLKSKR